MPANARLYDLGDGRWPAAAEVVGKGARSVTLVAVYLRPFKARLQRVQAGVPSRANWHGTPGSTNLATALRHCWHKNDHTRSFLE
jgi:hypothetical protein